MVLVNFLMSKPTFSLKAVIFWTFCTLKEVRQVMHIRNKSYLTTSKVLKFYIICKISLYRVLKLHLWSYFSTNPTFQSYLKPTTYLVEVGFKLVFEKCGFSKNPLKNPLLLNKKGFYRVFKSGIYRKIWPTCCSKNTHQYVKWHSTIKSSFNFYRKPMNK